MRGDSVSVSGEVIGCPDWGLLTLPVGSRPILRGKPENYQLVALRAERGSQAGGLVSIRAGQDLSQIYVEMFPEGLQKVLFAFDYESLRDAVHGLRQCGALQAFPAFRSR